MGEGTLSEGQGELASAGVFEQHRERIYRYIQRLVSDPDEAQDLTQETFLRAHRQLDSLQDRASLSTWLYRIATNVSYDRLRQSSRHRSQQPLDAGDDGQAGTELADVDGPGLDEVIDRAEMSTCVNGVVEKLPDDYRVVILLHDVQGLTNPQIAQILDCSLETVKIRLHRARRKLKEALTAQCNFHCDERGVFVCERKPPKR